MATATCYIEVELAEFKDRDLIRELESRGYEIIGKNNSSMEKAIWEYQRGNFQEMLIFLERTYPDLTGISKKVLT